MSRLGFILWGLFLIFFSLILLWLASPGARVMLAKAGVPYLDFQPKDVGWVFVPLFALGFVLTLGGLGESLLENLVKLLSSQPTIIDSPRSRLLLGMAAYLLLALVFGAYLIFFGSGMRDLRLYTDPTFLKFCLTWPYQLAAASRPFDLSPEAFY